ncbi:autotransporter outer membrane beta-barrel domain-containing protein [Methylobacter psychrophilus]|uniref:autotransporter outer membrane beta-barrel domain-containing protein n=1 Tax=Methylobacter psychrophilus TaxID=96941 RepID=UPI0021D4E9BD|nr:autotransporter outer membrane beta-barrel domain-containing protein [Methylobacter psychrophilus]
MSSATTQNFAFVKLTSNPSASTQSTTQWNGAPLTVTAGGETGSGTILMDTGINYMFLTPAPNSSLAIGTQPDDTTVDIYLPGQTTPQLAFYTITVGDSTNPLQPASVKVLKNPSPFVNTGRQFLQGFNYLYDAVDGYVGYQWNGNTASSAYANVTPMVAFQNEVDLPNGFVTDLPVVLMDNTTLTQSGSGIIAGNISGTGGLTFKSGILELSGTNTYTGSTTINQEASLDLTGSGSIATSTSLVNNGTFDISGTSTGTAISTLSGDGTINLGEQTLTLTQAVDTFTGAIQGTGGLTIASGSETLSGNNNYTGTTLVQGGVLHVNGSLASPVDVSVGGALRGTGEVNGPINVSGTLAPGNSPGTLTVTGPVTLNSGSIFEIDIDGTGINNGEGNYSRLLMNGSTSSFTANGTLNPLLRGITGNATNTFTPAIGNQFRIVTAQGGIQGRFLPLIQPTGLANGTSLDVFYNGGGSNSIDLFTTPASYANQIGLSDGNLNARSVGQTLDFMRGQDNVNLATSSQNELRYDLAGLNTAQILSAATALAGEVHGAMAAAAPEAGRWLQGAVARQLSASPGQEQPELKAGDNIWIDFNANQSSTNGGSTASGYSASRYQFAIGADILHSQTNRLGLGVTYASTNVGSTNGSGTLEEASPFLYGQYAIGKTRQVIFDGLFGYGFNTWQTHRADPLHISPTELKTDANGNSTSVSVGARSAWSVGYGVSIEPFTRVLWQNSSRGAVNEGMTSPAALNLASYGLNGTRLLVGTAIGSDHSDPLSTMLTYRASIAFGEDFDDLVYPTVQASLVGTNFQINAPKVGREFAQLALSTTYKVIDSAYIYAGLNGEARENRLDGGVNAGFNLKF